MNRYLIISLFVLHVSFLNQIIAQYSPLVRSDAVWRKWYTSPKGGHDLNEYITVEIDSDTIVNNVSYSHLVKTQHTFIESGKTTEWEMESYGYLREDSAGKVFYLGPKIYGESGPFYYYRNLELDTNEFLLYDFSLLAGDSLQYSWHSPDSIPITVWLRADSIDSISIGIETRKVIHLSNKKSYWATWIEGIGNRNGIIESFTTSFYTHVFTCYSNSDLIYPTQNQCDYLSLKDVSGEIELKAFPNPFNDRLTFQSDVTQADIKIFDVQGNLVHEQIVNGSVSLNLGHLRNGLYLASISENGRIVKNVKLMKQ